MDESAKDIKPVVGRWSPTFFIYFFWCLYIFEKEKEKKKKQKSKKRKTERESRVTSWDCRNYLSSSDKKTLVLLLSTSTSSLM